MMARLPGTRNAAPAPWIARATMSSGVEVGEAARDRRQRKYQGARQKNAPAAELVAQ
jgi:hypothetical protein